MRNAAAEGAEGPYIYLTQYGYPRIDSNYRVARVEIDEPDGMLGTLRKVKGTGRYRKGVLYFWPANGIDGGTVSRSTEGVRKRLRRMRERDIAELRTLNAEIKQLNARKAALIENAWKAAESVPLSELEAKLDQGAA